LTEIARKGAQARWSQIAKKPNNNNSIVLARRPKPITPGQGILDLKIEKQIEIVGSFFLFGIAA